MADSQENLQVISLNDEKVILLGDTHFGARSDSQLFHDFFEQFFEYMFEYMKQNSIKTIVQFGDLFDRRKFVNYVTLKRCREYFFDKIRDNGFTLIAFLGNHDVSYKNTLDVASPVLLIRGQYDDCVIILNEPAILEWGNSRALCVPWICASNEEACLKHIAAADTQMCFGHFEISGFEMYKGAPSHSGLDSEVFWRFESVYSGHFHHVSTRGNITYIGSPYQIMWSDHGDERGFFVLDTKKRASSFIPNPYHMFYKWLYDDSVIGYEDIELIDFNQYASRYVKVIVKDKTDLIKYDRFIEKLNAVGAIVTPVEDHQHKNIVSDDEIALEAEDTLTFFKKISDNADSSVDSFKLYTLLVDLYTEATNNTII